MSASLDENHEFRWSVLDPTWTAWPAMNPRAILTQGPIGVRRIAVVVALPHTAITP